MAAVVEPRRSARWNSVTNPRPRWGPGGKPKAPVYTRPPTEEVIKTKKHKHAHGWLLERVGNDSVDALTFYDLKKRVKKTENYREAVTLGGALLHGWLQLHALHLMTQRPEPEPQNVFFRLRDGTYGSCIKKTERHPWGKGPYLRGIYILDTYLTPTQVHSLCPGTPKPPNSLPILIHGGGIRVVSRREIESELCVDAVPLRFAPICRHLFFIRSVHSFN